MKSSKAFLYRFYLPLLLALLLVLLTILTPKLISGPTTAVLEAELKVGLLGLKIPLAAWAENAWIARVTTYSVAGFLFLYATSLDFSRYFPTKLKLDAYFDAKGIERTLELFTEEAQAALDIDKNWKDKISEYDKDVVASLKQLWKAKGLSDVWPDDASVRDVIHASGETTFVVDRVGVLTYKIKESEGLLGYEADFPRRERRQFRGEFHLRDTASNYIRPKILDLIKSPSVLISPQFKQVFQLDSWATSGPFDHILIAATRISLLPFPSFGDSIYLWKSHDGGWIPVAYCVYH